MEPEPPTAEPSHGLEGTNPALPAAGLYRIPVSKKISILKIFVWRSKWFICPILGAVKIETKRKIVSGAGLRASTQSDELKTNIVPQVSRADAGMAASIRPLRSLADTRRSGPIRKRQRAGKSGALLRGLIKGWPGTWVSQDRAAYRQPPECLVCRYDALLTTRQTMGPHGLSPVMNTQVF